MLIEGATFNHIVSEFICNINNFPMIVNGKLWIFDKIEEAECFLIEICPNLKEWDLEKEGTTWKFINFKGETVFLFNKALLNKII